MSEAMFLGALGTLATVIAALWKIIWDNVKEVKARSKDLEKKNEENEKWKVDTATRMGRLEGEVHLAKSVVPLIEKLSGDFLLFSEKLENKLTSREAEIEGS